MTERNSAQGDRRRSPRFTCGGDARINRLPWDGIIAPGKIHDLSLGGCYLDTTLPLDCGVRTEILVHVNAASFRGIGEVRVSRVGGGTGIEFLQLSAAGRDNLAEIIAELATSHAVLDRIRSTRRDMDAASFRRQIEDKNLQEAVSNSRLPFLGTILRTETSQLERHSASSQESSSEAPPLVIRVDLFG